MALPTRRTLSKVKSSAIMPRHPSVPNLICVAIDSCFASVNSGGLHQPLHLLLVEIFHNFADILRMLTRGDEQGIFRFDDDEIADPNRCDKLVLHVNEVPRGVQRETLIG